jgi:hypothetical protein
MTPRERALERLMRVAPHLPNAGTVVNELVAAYEVAEVVRDWTEANAEYDVSLLEDALKRFDEATVTS